MCILCFFVDLYISAASIVVIEPDFESIIEIVVRWLEVIMHAFGAAAPHHLFWGNIPQNKG